MNIFTPTHPAVSRGMKQRLLWMNFNPINSGGVAIPAHTLRNRFYSTYEQGAIAITSPLTIIYN